MVTRLKRPRDPIQLAKLIGDIATGQVEDKDLLANKNQIKATSGRKGGIKGGVHRAKALMPEKRSEIARNAAVKRWGKNR